jgi:hypothetical protein
MEKVIHLFETFKNILYFNFSEQGKVLFGLVTVWKDLNLFEYAFGPNSNRRLSLLWPRAHLSVIQPPFFGTDRARTRRPLAPARVGPLPADSTAQAARQAPHVLLHHVALPPPPPLLRSHHYYNSYLEVIIYVNIWKSKYSNLAYMCTSWSVACTKLLIIVPV